MSSLSGASGGIHGLLLKLHESLSDEDSRSAALTCQDIVGDLGHECMLTSIENDLVLQTSLLFSKDDGLLSFLRKSMQSDELRDTRVKILLFLGTFLDNVSARVKGWEKTYAIDLKDTCMVVYIKDKLAKCRTPVLELLIKVLQKTKTSSVAADFRIGEMFTRFYSELCQKTKLPDSVLGKIYELLGVLAEVHPSEMANNSDKLYKAYLGELKDQMMSSTKEPKLVVVAGCLTGISALMVNFTKTMEEDPATCQEIFQFALKAISPQMTMTRYAVTFAGLRLLARHASQFSSCLMDHYKTLFDVMSKLCGHINAEMKKTSYYALEAFLKQVAMLVADNTEEHKSKLKFFMQKFCGIIKTMESTQKELSIAIRGYGFFAAPCKKVCPQDVDLMYTELIQRCKQMYLTESEGEDDSFYQLPSFLDSIASVLIHLDKVPEVYTPLLERLLVVQIDTFPQYSERMQKACCRSILKVLVAVASKGPVLWSFIGSVVHQGLIRVCSKPIMLPENNEDGKDNSQSSQVRTGKWKVPSSENYLGLFKELLDCDHLKDSGFLDGAFQSQNSALVSLSRLLYDELVKSILRIVEKLDLSVQKVATGEETPDDTAHALPSSDPTAHLLPNRVKDFTAFINLVEFCSELLRTKHVEYFESWMYPLSHELILHSIRNPLVSGFYKLLSVTMKIAKRIKYYQGVGLRSSTCPQSDSVKSACFALLSKFGKEVCVRMKQYKDELLSSCLTFVLSLHHNIVAVDIKAYCPALEAALKLGLSHAPLANAALDALEDWSSHLPLETLQPCYTNILPLLDGYLKTTSGSNKDDGSWEVMSSSSSRSDRGYGKVMTRLLKQSKQFTMEDAPLVAVRLRVVKLLGHLGGKLNRNLVNVVSSEETMKKFVAWDTEKRLSFAVPFADMKPVIYLDPFLPRISELALSTSDRQTKVAACELLHSLVVYMVGKSAQMVEGKSSLPPMYKLHKRLFPVLLRLACDVDQVTRQLFEPLVMQLIHWFTNNKKFESQDTVAVLEAILDGVVDPMDSTLRDFCGRCIEEFVKWSIKQTTPKQQEKSPTNMKSLFKRIYSLALHPNGFKRLGAALAFNSIYRHFREENSLVEQFVFEVLVVFVESLALAHSDERSMGSLQQCRSAIDHLKRIIKYKAPSLSQHNVKRRVPRGFPPDEKLLLSDVVLWLLEQCGRPQTECRHKCMELFYEFVPLLPEKSSPSQWLDAIMKDKGVSFLISRFEGGGLLAQPTLRDLTGPFSVRATLQWMDLLLAALDCYNTFISLRIIKPQHMPTSKDKSSFLKSTHFFLTELATQDLAAAESCFPLRERSSHFSPREVDQYNYSKCTITVRLLEFATMILVKGDPEFIKLLEGDLFCAVFFDLTALVVCEPSTVGFNMADVEVMKNLPEVCVPLLKALLNSTYRTRLESSLRTKITRTSVEELCAVDFYNLGTVSHHEKMEMLLSSCKQINKADFLSSILHSQDPAYVKSLGSRLLMTVYKGIAPGEDRKALPSLDVNTRRVADGLLQLAFSLSQQSEQLVDLLLNTITLSVPISGSHTKNVLNFSHGEYFYSLFNMTVNTELLRSLDTAVPRLMTASSQNPAMVSVLLNGMLDHSFRERSVRKTQGKQLVEEVLRRWSSLQSWWEGDSSTPESKTATLLLLSKLLQIDSSVCSNVNHEAFRQVFSTFTVLLMDMNLPLNLKSQALLVLPFFTILPDEPLAELQRALDALVVSHFPMQSDEFAKGSLHRNNYMDCVRKMLDALELSQSPLLLKVLSGILCRDRKHIMEEQFQTCFQRVMKRSNRERQLQLLCTVYGVIQQGDVPVNSMLQAMMERVLLPLASNCSTAALVDFFVANVSDIIALLLSRLTKSSETAFELQLLKKSGCYKLIELLYSRLPKEEVYSKESRINQAFCRSDKTEGNEMSKTLIKSCFEAFTENMAGETQLLELRRQNHCAAYNCAIAVISCSFNEAKFYQGFLFNEKAEKNQFILENIIDVGRTYNFPVEIEVPLERKKKYVMIRKEVNEESGEAPVYLSSQSYMADSSLSEEMSQFDFSTGVQSFSFSSQNPEGHKRTVARKETEETSPSQDAMVDLEMDELNQHECMATMTALIGHMQRNGITPKIEQGNMPSDLPPWMKFLHVKLSNPATPLNIRLFISKLIINTEEVFRPYAKHWLGPLLQLVVSGNNGGEGIHFMVVDIVVTVLSWISLASPKGNPRDEILANRLLEFLMKHSFHSKRAVFRHNLEIIRTLVECWKDCLHVPYSVIFERFCGTDPNSKDNSVGLQLLGIILANNLPAYDALCGIEYERYINSLTNNLSFVKYKDVYSAAAEIIGLILKNMTEMENEHQQLLSLAATKITNLKKNNMDDKFVICLNKVSKHFPPFMDRFVNHVFSLLPRLHGILKTDCLECVLSRAEVIPDIFMQLKVTGFIQMMSHRDEARQRVCLDIIHKIIGLLTPVQLQEFLGAVTAFVSHPSPVCRERMYAILMWIQDNYSDAESMEDNTSVEVLNAAKETLLHGLSEENQGLQLYVRNFWSQEKRLPTATLDRMLAVLQSLYSCQIERCFLSLVTNLLLEMTSQSPDFTRDMFEYPLSECTFQDYVIDSNWRFRSTVMTPMFVETQTSQGLESATATQTGAIKGKLRATQTSLEFTQTQTSGRGMAYNWLTGSSVDTLAEYTPGSESLSSLLVFDKKSERRIAARRPVGEGFGLKRLAAPTDELDSRTRAANEQRNNILRLRRRFLKDQEKVSLNHAQREIQQQKQKKVEKSDQRLRKEAQVTLYRSYRVGDFPDIQIPHSNLIAPLQTLAQRDPILAKQLFSSLFAGVLQEMDKLKGGESARIKEELRCNMNMFLSKSTLCFPPFVACVQDMCRQHRELQQLDPAAISSTCLVSLQQPSGILLLEESLLHTCVKEEPPAKRSRGRREIPPDTNKWIHLARLYRSLEDYDVVRSIFGGKVGTKSITCAALESEANADLAEAVKLYNEAINTEDWRDGEPTDAEKDFWETAAMEAYSQLTEWKSLQYCSTVNLDENSPPNLEKVWSEPFYQEMYLRHMIRSMLKQLQQGERDQTLLTFVDKAMRAEESKKLLESHYSQELSLLYILQEDYDRAKYYTKYAMQLFIESYSSVDTLLTQSRLTILQSVQALTEIQDFLLFITGEVSVSALKRLIRLWTERYPDAKVDPMNIWDDIITSRCFFLDKIREKLRGHATTDSMEVDGSEDPAGEVDTLVNDCKFNMKLHMANSAQKQNNFAVATKLLKELHREAKTNRSLLLPWVHSFSHFSHKRCQTQGPVEQISNMLKTIPLLEDLQSDCERATAKVFRYQKTLQGTSFDILATAVSRSPSVLGTIDADKAARVVELSGAALSNKNPKKVEVGLQLRALKLLCGATRKADEELQSYTHECVESSSISETYMTLANFCDKRLRDEEQGDAASHFPDLLALPVHVMESMLKALKMNSEEARLKFPRLLQVIELYPSETLDLMTKEMTSVPCWMLIGWISQMVALLDKPEAVAVQHCIERIAECYPQALVYALMISSESFQFEDSATGHRQQEFVNRLRSMLDERGAVKKFVDALQQLTNPDMIFRDWWDNVKNEMEKPSFNKEQMGNMYDEMRSSLGDRDKPGHGAFRKKFIQKFAKDVENLLGSKGSKLFEKRKSKDFVRQVEQLAGNMRDVTTNKAVPPGNLKEYSPWLSGFKADPFSNELEIPGQYDGRSKPLPEYHAKITGFDERVKVMTSIRRPKRLIIRGDDERDHPFLVKGGEDLRQDQRIEQLFSVMNILLSHDAACTRRGLQLRTYQVIPINTRIGLIEWMENTTTLKEFLNSTMTDDEQQSAKRCLEVYNTWLSTFEPQKGVVSYSFAYRKAKRADAVNNFLKVLQHVPSDLLRRAFLKMCNSPEAFLFLRSHFISSHALLCVSHWILGIGDRHLSNFMINMETGGMIGIDFGHAFGSATQFLPVPELMPFRLTRQFVNLMQPLKESGLIQSVMVHSLRAFRAEPDLLLNTMDVFVKEPSLDWKNFELKQLKKGGTWTENTNTKEINWYPLQKVNFARRKLEGANPATITSEELKLGFEKDAAFQGMQSVALGTQEHNIRAKLPAADLSVEKQVDCLIDQATDPNVLGRVWAGWEPWF
ncbi:DNA-dependent protein kinase catalytic subunit [Solea senegalensis]|uniref:DNA-dependent protein kinase catalytic subunit n=1 Tax=Solea senegalensis TaxID=28829 RepID=A0AAV6T6A0_SOLSE|nr:DNA-dependent protein kinase catalytic subunit isoform X2 [Solea senegalensis]KAG7524628.1 DNA-dependent protein kinase catalytic subunit [Solea senegalensis]